MKKHHLLYAAAAIGALLYWRSAKAKKAAANTPAPANTMQNLAQQIRM